MSTLKRALAIVPLLCLGAASWPSHAAAQNVPFKVYVTELWQLDAGVDPGLGYIGDYYAEVTINGVEQGNGGACDDPSSGGIVTPFRLFKNFDKISECGKRTPWVFRRDVPGNQPVTVKIQLFDSDAVFDDEGDAKPGPGSAVEFTVDPVSGLWSGDFTWPQVCSRPGLEGGGNNVNVCWQMGFDADDDGLLDVWERMGVDTDNDGVLDLDLAALGAHPMRKDIFLEVDHLQSPQHTHRPLQAAIMNVILSFANAPVANPDGTSGIQLHIDVGAIYPGITIAQITGAGGATGTFGNLGGGNMIAEAGNLIIEAFEDAKSSGTKFADLKTANFNLLREPVFRYVIFGHQNNSRAAANDCTSGVASRTRRDFMVTLGGVDVANRPCRAVDTGGFSVGDAAQQGGTLMHELGHVLGLRHGGDEDLNKKPNYLSVMNYSFQACGVPPGSPLLPFGCDYSRLVNGALLDPLDETDLDECLGLGAALAFGPVDWNGTAGATQGASCGTANVVADTNEDGVCVKPGPNGTQESALAGDDTETRGVIYDGPDRVCNSAKLAGSDDEQETAVGATPSQPNAMKSFDDWARVTPSHIDFSIGFGTGTGDLDQEPDTEDLIKAQRYLSTTMQPAVTVEQTGPSTGQPGDVLTYTASVANTGRGPAVGAVFHHTAPDGTVTTTEPGIVAVGTGFLHTMTFTVPAGACPGDFTGAAAALSFKDFGAQALSAGDTVALEILDVAAPSVELAVSPDVLWPPNHQFVEITATVTSTDNCDPNPAVRLVSIVSNEPATGVIGAGDQGPDIEGAAYGTDDRTFSLRSERDTGQGHTGRVYTITYRVTDSSGNATEKTALVTVPVNQGG